MYKQADDFNFGMPEAVSRVTDNYTTGSSYNPNDTVKFNKTMANTKAKPLPNGRTTTTQQFFKQMEPAVSQLHKDYIKPLQDSNFYRQVVNPQNYNNAWRNGANSLANAAVYGAPKAAQMFYNGMVNPVLSMPGHVYNYATNSQNGWTAPTWNSRLATEFVPGADSLSSDVGSNVGASGFGAVAAPYVKPVVNASADVIKASANTPKFLWNLARGNGEAQNMMTSAFGRVLYSDYLPISAKRKLMRIDRRWRGVTAMDTGDWDGGKYTKINPFDNRKITINQSTEPGLSPKVPDQLNYNGLNINDYEFAGNFNPNPGSGYAMSAYERRAYPYFKYNFKRNARRVVPGRQIPVRGFDKATGDTVKLKISGGTDNTIVHPYIMDNIGTNVPLFKGDTAGFEGRVPSGGRLVDGSKTFWSPDANIAKSYAQNGSAYGRNMHPVVYVADPKAAGAAYTSEGIPLMNAHDLTTTMYPERAVSKVNYIKQITDPSSGMEGAYTTVLSPGTNNGSYVTEFFTPNINDPNKRILSHYVRKGAKPQLNPQYIRNNSKTTHNFTPVYPSYKNSGVFTPTSPAEVGLIEKLRPWTGLGLGVF